MILLYNPVFHQYHLSHHPALMFPQRARDDDPEMLLPPAVIFTNMSDSQQIRFGEAGKQ